MKTLTLKVLDERAKRPCGNPFEISAVEITSSASQIHTIRTGLMIDLSNDMTLEIVAAREGITVIGWCSDDEGLKVSVVCPLGIVCDKPFALVYIVERKKVPVRFVEFSNEGGRLIRGDAKEVKNA